MTFDYREHLKNKGSHSHLLNLMHEMVCYAESFGKDLSFRNLSVTLAQLGCGCLHDLIRPIPAETGQEAMVHPGQVTIL